MIKNVKIEDIIVTANRFRPISLTAVERLAESIIETGLLEPIIISQDNKLLAGNHRLEAFKMNAEEVIPCHIYKLEVGDNGKMVEYAENEFRSELTLSEKQNVYKEIRAIKDARAKNCGTGANQHKSAEAASSESVSATSKKETDDKSKEIRKADAVEAGFTNLTEQQRVGGVVNNGIPELVEAMDNEDITPTGAKAISMLDKEDQLDALNDKMDGVTKKPKKGDGIRKSKLDAMKKSDKYGAFIDIKLYKNDPVQSAKNIAKHYGDIFREPFLALLVEMSRELSRFDRKNVDGLEPDLYRSYSYGFQKICDADVIEISSLLKQGAMSKSAIADAYGISHDYPSKIEKLDLDYDIND